jgi:hypothetical protein
MSDYVAAQHNANATEDERNARQDTTQALLNPVTFPDSFVIALTGRSFGDTVLNSIIAAWQQARVDQQIGASTTGRGATDLVSRPSTSDLIGLAMQTGALTETVQGTTATFQANADGAYRALVGLPTICPDCNPVGAWNWANLNASVSFDLTGQTNRTVNTSGPANASTPSTPAVLLPQQANQFTQLDVKYNIANPIDPRSANFKEAWRGAFAKHRAELMTAAGELDRDLESILDPLINDPKLAALQAAYLPQLAANSASVETLYPVFQAFFEQVAALARLDVPELDERVRAAVGALARYSQINYAVVQEATGAQWTLEYMYDRPQDSVDMHTIRVIGGFTPANSTSGTLFTMNLAATIYGSQMPASANYRRLRDLQAAAQLDRPIGDRITHPVTLSLAGYLQYQFDPSVLNITSGNLAPGTDIPLPQNAQVLLGTRGLIAIAQAKATITRNGLNIPISIEWANKSDLLTGSDIRGNIGLTYNFDSMTQLFGH